MSHRMGILNIINTYSYLFPACQIHGDRRSIGVPMGITAETREVASTGDHWHMGILSNRWIITKMPFRWLVMSIFDITSYCTNAEIYRENQANIISTDKHVQ